MSFTPRIQVDAVIDPSLAVLFELRLKLLHFSRADIVKRKVIMRKGENKLMVNELI